MRLLFLGDIVGFESCKLVCKKLPELISDYSLDFVIVNGENVAGGFGITPSQVELLLDAGADVITTGNHVADKPILLQYLEREYRILRPANYPSTMAGRGVGFYNSKKGARILVANLMGKVFMHGQLSDPFAAAEEAIKGCFLGECADAIIVDFHAEVTSEKQCLGHFLDGRISLLVGTHTHVPTADYKILSNGTGYISDVGMCGDYDSSLGFDKEEPINRFLGKSGRSPFEVAAGEITICGVGVNISDTTGLVEAIEPVRIGAHLQPAFPSFWS